MPIYEYRCKKCLKIFEKILFSSEKDQPQSCPDCMNSETEKVLSRTTSFTGSTSDNCADSCTSAPVAPSCSHAGGG